MQLSNVYKIRYSTWGTATVLTRGIDQVLTPAADKFIMAPDGLKAVEALRSAYHARIEVQAVEFVCHVSEAWQEADASTATRAHYDAIAARRNEARYKVETKDRDPARRWMDV